MMNNEYIMDYIPNKALFKAVMFATRMMREGVNPGLAAYKAAKYYGVDQSDVSYYVGQRGGRRKGKKAHRRS